MYQEDDGRVIIEQDDQCARCYFNRKRKPVCPLLEGLHARIFFLDTEVSVKACDLYKPRLSVVPHDNK